MQRITIALQAKPGMKKELKTRLLRLDTQVLLPLSLNCVHNLSVWGIEDLAFCYGEVSGVAADDEAKALVSRLLNYLQDCCVCLANPFENPMRLMYEDIGIVREDKSGIRHRVFVTRLKPGFAEEYKLRHDNLIASRKGSVNHGPDSNFTIWNTGDYIFGYCEIDRSMEKAPTEESRQATVAWETRMLEIMDWITDDVDWLTGLKHDKVELLFKQG